SPSDHDLGRLELPAGRRVGGKVLDATARPIAGARVVALSPPARGRRGAGAGFARRIVRDGTMPPFPATALTAAARSFTLDALPERPVTLRAWADKLAPGLVENVRAGSVTIRLAEGCPLAGHVVSPDGKTPVGGAQVIAGDDGWDGVARTAADGSFHFE